MKVQREQFRSGEAEESYGKALDIYETIKNDLGRANALNGLGDVQIQHSKYTEARVSYIKALKIYQEIGSSRGRVKAKRGLAETHRAQFKHSKAEESYAETPAIYNESRLASLGSGQGFTQFSGLMVRPLEAIYPWRSEVTQSDALAAGNSLDQAVEFIEQGDVHRQQLIYPKADEAYDNALTIYNNIQSDLGQKNASRGSGESKDFVVVVKRL